MANVEKLEAVLDYIRMHPEEHDQTQWAYNYQDEEDPADCGTSYCFAGTAIVMAGYQISWDRLRHGAREANKCVVASGDELELGFAPGEAYIDAVAARELGLNGSQANRLFYESASLDDVERVVKDIINEQVRDV